MIDVISRVADIDRITFELARDPHLISHHTQRGYKADLAAFEIWRDGRIISKSLLEGYIAQMQSAGRSPSTINRMLAAIRWWARRLADLALEDSSLPTDQVEMLIMQANRVAMINDVEGNRLSRDRDVTRPELDALLYACELDSIPAGVRDAAIISLAWATGTRRSEIASLRLSDFVPYGDDSGDLIIKGERDKMRSLYIFNGAFSSLTDWVILRGNDPGPLFCAIGKGGKIHIKQSLSGEAMRLILENRIGQAGVNPLTWHDFRRTFAGNLLNSGVDLVSVQKLMGHANPTTTSNYDRRGDEVKRNEINSLFVPYHRRPK
jgi:site-specific recombinase XerD